MTTALLLSCVLLAAGAQAAPSRETAARAFLARMGAVADRLDALLNELEDPSPRKDPVRRAAALEELAAQGAKAEALGLKADKLLKRSDLPRGKHPVTLRGGRMSWLEAGADPGPDVRAQELAGARLNVLAAQYSLLSIALSTEMHEGERLTYRAELAKAKAALDQLKRRAP